jgi:hypothetical protein
MSRKKLIYLHIFIWLFAIFANLPYASIGKGMPPRLIVSNAIGFLYLMVVFYLFYLVLAPRFLNRKKLFEFFGFSLIVVLVMPFFGYNILFLSRAFFEGTFHDFYKGYTLKMHMSAFYPVLTAAVFGSFFSVIINWFSTMNQKAELDRQKLGIELDLLKSKLNPHFLFNTLNNIDSLIAEDPDRASASLITLSEIMRYLTYETSSDFVPLEKEISYIRNFTDLYIMRIKEPGYIRIDIEADPMKKIAPALFVPLLENAFKFATFGKTKPSIDLNLRTIDGKIIFRISNYYEMKAGQGENCSGYGLINLRKRLELTYPGRYQMTTEDNEQQYKVILTINSDAD